MARRRGRGEGSIYQRKDGLWVASITWTDPAGKVHRPCRYRKTRALAREALRDLERDARRGRKMAGKAETLEEYLTTWLEGSVQQSVRPRVYDGYQSIVTVRIAPHIGRLMLEQVTPPTIQQLYSALAAEGLSPRSVINTHRVLRRALQQAVKWDMIARNPCDAVDVPRAPRRETRVLDRDQVQVLLESTAGTRRHALYMIAVTGGLRLGELLGLQWSDIDFAAGRVVVQRTCQHQRGIGLVFAEPKTSKSRRTVHLSHRAIATLKEHRIRQLEERLLIGSEWTDLDMVFPNYTGGMMHPGNVGAPFKKDLTAAGLPEVRFHDLRHTAATLLLSAGTHPKLVSEMIGHSSIAITLDTYSHVIPAMHQEAAATMDRLFGGRQ